jgi:hypothetical protein
VNETKSSSNYFRIALQSGLAAGISLGLPAGLLFWLILLQKTNNSAIAEQAIAFFRANGLNQIFVLVLFSLLWSFFLGRISGYRPRWHIGLATALGIIAGWFSPLSNLDGLLSDSLTVHRLYTIAISGIIASVTICVGLAYGLILRNIKAALSMALGTSFVSVIVFLITVMLFEQSSIYVGITPFAMSRITATGMLTSAIAGGMMLGVLFRRFIKK